MTRSDALQTSSSAPEPHDHHEGPPPSPWLMALEFRAAWELGAIVPFWPLLQRAPRGDGHPVIVFPGLSASDGSTMPLRSYLIDRAGVELELCPDCRGVWLERDELDKIMDNVGLSSRNLIYSSGARRQDSFVSELFDF